MMTKTAYYMQMAQEAAAQITGSKEQWTAFLTTSARLYKYPFAEQLMIYKQRPEATACAEYDLWNDRMNRYVNRGSILSAENLPQQAVFLRAILAHLSVSL